jgi:glycosyltransferase involved in cell wall biosynthesis
MKILQVINSMATGGAEKLLLETIPKYADKEISMDLLVLNGNDHPFYSDFKKTNPLQLFSLGKSSVYNPFLVFKLVKYLKKYDIIHVHLFPALYWVALAKWISFSDVKLVFTEHSTSNRRMNNWFLKIIDRFMYSKYTKIICITNEVENQIKKQLQFSDEKFIVIQNGIDLNKINQSKSYTKSELNLALPEDAKLLLQVASFQFPKDQATVIKSLQHLLENVHLLLAGEGVLLEKSVELVKQLNLNTRVHFLGVRMDIPNLLKTADIVILSSQYEGLSLSCIEGLASGKPFVASDVPGLREIVDEPKLLFPFQNDVVLAEIILELLNDKDKYEVVVNHCLQRAKQFDISIMIENHVKLYKSLL